MRKIAHLSDIHVDGRGRPEDLRRVLEAFLAEVHRECVDIILIAGDFYERRSTPEERTFLAEFLQRAAEIAPVAGARGNHDAPGDLEILNRLETRCPIFIADRATALPDSAWMVSGAHGGEFGVLALPWVDKAHLVATLDATVDSASSTVATVAALRELLTCLRAEAEHVRSVGAIPLLVTHVMLGGSLLSNGQTLIGQGVELSPADLLDVGCAYAACGHIHISQDFHGGRVAYSGSPDRHDFGEAKEPKGWRLVTLTDEGEFRSNEFRELPALRMVLLEEDWTSQDKLIARWPHCSAQDVAGALVRFRYRVRAEDLHLVDERALETSFLAGGAHDVKLEAVVEAATRVRSEEIAHVQTVGEKLDVFLVAKSIEVDEAQRTRLHEKLERLEARA
jgi:exonuclease SbcD